MCLGFAWVPRTIFTGCTSAGFSRLFLCLICWPIRGFINFLGFVFRSVLFTVFGLYRARCCSVEWHKGVIF